MVISFLNVWKKTERLIKKISNAIVFYICVKVLIEESIWMLHRTNDTWKYSEGRLMGSHYDQSVIKNSKVDTISGL